MTHMKKLLCGALAASVFICAGCSLVTVDKEKDMQQVVATVNDAPILKRDLADYFNQTANMYAQYGMDISQMGDIPGIVDSLLEDLITEEVVKQQAKTQGLAELSAEEAKVVEENYNQLIDGYAQSFMEDAKKTAGENASDEALKREAIKLLEADIKKNGYSFEMIRQDFTDQKVQEKLQDSVNASVSVEESEISQWYNTNLEEQKKQFTETPALFVNAMSAGDPVVFVPSGYVYAKRILIIGPENQDLRTQMQDKVDEQQDLASQMTELIVDDKTKNAAEIDALETKINEAKKAYQQLRDTWLSSVKARADEALAKVKAGEDFDALIAAYGEDENMSLQGADGYLVGKGVDLEQEVIDATLALENAGDASELIASMEGFSIVKLTKKLQSRDVPLSEVHEAALEVVRAEKQQNTWTDKQKEWREAAKVEKFTERYKDIGAA